VRRRQRSLGLKLERLESRMVLSTVTWTGLAAGSNPNWSAANNWSPKLPAATDDLVFPTVTGSALTSNNDLTAGTGFNSLTISGSGYSIGGHGIALTATLEASQSAGSSTVNLPVDFGGNPGVVKVDTAGAVLVQGGIVNGTGGLNKQGAGELDLTAANTYTGATTVNAGVLHVDGSLTGTVTTSAGATLGGVGTVGSISTTNGILSPGDATPGILTDTGDLTLTSSSTYKVTLNSDTVFSQTQAGGAISLGGATLSLSLGFTPTGTDQFTILKNNGSGSITGTFAGLAEGAIVTASGEQFKLTYKGGAGHDVVLTHLVDTTTTLSPVTITPVFGQAVALTATVTANTAGLGTPTGSMDFKSGTTDLGSATVSSAGVATLNTTSLPTGADSITAVYSGDPTFAGSTSPAIAVTVGQAATRTTLSTSPNPSVASQQVTVTATVAALSPGSGIPTGSVEFFNGSTDLGPGTLSGGVATLRTSSLPVRSNTITAVYSGDANFTTSTTTPGVTQQVNLGNVTVRVSIPNTNPFGLSPVALSATVAASTSGTGVPAPTGSVSFFDLHGTNLGSASLTNGTASLTVSSLPIGSESITAVYGGDSNYGKVTSPAVAMVVGNRAELFVNQVFLDVFGAPAGYGENYWVALFNGGVAPKQVASLIVNSQPSKSAAVNNAYVTYLGRPATTAESIRVLAVANPSLIALDATLLGSREFYVIQGGGTTQGFLTALGHAWFGPQFSFAPKVRDRLTRQLVHGTSRREVALGVITSPSGITTEVNNLVEGILGRPATRQEINRFGPIIKRGQIGPVAVSLFGSREFLNKYVSII
jgi:autotransporter-associated beta strand protein